MCLKSFTEVGNKQHYEKQWEERRKCLASVVHTSKLDQILIESNPLERENSLTSTILYNFLRQLSNIILLGEGRKFYFEYIFKLNAKYTFPSAAAGMSQGRFFRAKKKKKKKKKKERETKFMAIYFSFLSPQNKSSLRADCNEH